MIKTLKTLHGKVKLPTFFPDGTLAVVRGVDSTDLETTGVEGLVINTYHLLANKLVERVKGFQGIHNFMRWKRPIITDSGGFQVMSLIHDNPKLGKIDDEKIVFNANLMGGSGEKIIFTPELSIQVQLDLGADIAIVLDDCTKPGQSQKEQEKSVERTIEWAKRSKAEFEKLCLKSGKKHPLLLAVVQGGSDLKLRKECAKKLVKIGFDGYCYGGFPVDDNGRFLGEVLETVAKSLPDNKIKYALGVGRPENIVESFKMGYGLFDCVIPTREARHKKLYIFNKNPQEIDILREEFYQSLYLGSSQHQNSTDPLSRYCDCLTCQHYSKAYLYHLFKIGDSLAVRLATIHNLRFYSMLMEKLKVIASR